MTKHAAAYIRRSSVSTDSPGDASREAQQEATRRLASAFAPDMPVVEYADWGISGRRDDRPAYIKLKAAIQADSVCCVFAYSLSRLGRTARELDALFTLCEQHDVQVITQADGTLTASSATGKFLRRILAELAELESELAKERVHAALDAKRERGDVFGQPTWGFRHEVIDGRLQAVPDPSVDVSPVLEAMREAGSVLGAARLLQERGVAAPKGGSRWSTSALTRILDRHAPELLQPRTATGRRGQSKERQVTSAFAGLLRCHCGRALLTPNRSRGQLYCRFGHVEGATEHGKVITTERLILPWVQEEVGRASASVISYDTEEDDSSARRAAILERMDRASELYLAGDIDRARFEAERTKTQAELDALPQDEVVLAVNPEIGPLVDWDADPAEVNRRLRAVFREIRMGPDMRPVEAVWRRPEWRKAS